MYLIYGICGRGPDRHREYLGLELDEARARERARGVACQGTYSAIVRDTLKGTIFLYHRLNKYRWPLYGSAQVIPLPIRRR